jgi:hypothetical protein
VVNGSRVKGNIGDEKKQKLRDLRSRKAEVKGSSGKWKLRWRDAGVKGSRSRENRIEDKQGRK